MAAHKKPGTIYLLVSCLFLLTGCDLRPDVVRIGFVGPFDGPYREFGAQLLEGARYAFDEWNKDSHNTDFTVNLVAYNDYGLSDEAVGAAKSIEVDENIDIVIGHWLRTTTEAVSEEYLTTDRDLIYFLPIERPQGHNMSISHDIINEYIEDNFNAARYYDACSDGIVGSPGTESTCTLLVCDPEIFFDSRRQDRNMVYILGSEWSPSEDGADTALIALGEKGPFFMQGYLAARYAITRVALRNAKLVSADELNMNLERKNMFMVYFLSGQSWELRDIAFGG